jgi:uncharacterized protein
MTFLLDTNILMALGWENHEHHRPALSWLRGVGAFATCPFVQGGFVRISSHPQLGFAAGPGDAFRCLDSIIGQDRHVFVPDDLSFDSHELGRERIQHHGQVTDHYLVGLARRHKLCLATFDEPLAKAFAADRSLVHLVRS